MNNVILGFYAVVLAGLMVFALHRLRTVWLYIWHSRKVPMPEVDYSVEAPLVCIQCPLYNEPLVVRELLEKVSQIRWKEGRLEIQILDDSTDETTGIIEGWLAEHPKAARNMRLVRRPKRTGYKAGALSYGMGLTSSEFIAIFDADFLPEPDFLESLMPHFVNPKVGVVQARWDFRNRTSSLLTRFQGIFLDAHFVVEQEARFASGCFFNFNGTAGMWRRAALEDAGGWSDDTVTEDLDVSYRAQLRGWKFVYLVDYVVLSELPENITAFKSQQRRWAKGAMQVARKQVGAVLRSGVSWKVKSEAMYHLLVGFVHPLLMLFCVSFVPYLILRDEQAMTGIWTVFNPLSFLLLGCGTAIFYITAQYLRRRQWHEAVLWFITSPFMLAFGLAMSVTCCVAVFEGLWEKGGEFVRTPKGGKNLNVGSIFDRFRKKGVFFGITAAELGLGTLMAFGAVHFALLGNIYLPVILGIKAIGFFGLALLTLRDLVPLGAAKVEAEAEAVVKS